MKVSEHISIFKRAVKMCYDRDRAYVLAVIMGQIVGGIMPYVPIYFSAKLVDALFEGAEIKTIVTYVLFTIGLTLVLGLLRKYISSVENYTENNMYREENASFSRKAMEMAYESIEDRKVAGLRERIRRETQTGYNRFYLYQCISRLSNAITQIVASFALSVSFFAHGSIPVYMKLMLVAFIVLTLAASMLTTAKSKKLEAEFSEQNVDINVFLNAYVRYVNNYSAGKDILMYDMQDCVTKRWTDMEQEFNGRMFKLGTQRLLFNIVNIFMNDVLKFITYMLLIYAAVNGGMPVGSIAKNVSCVMLMLGAVKELISTCQIAAVNNTYLKRYFSYLDIPNNMYQGTLTVEKRDDNEYYVEFRDVSFKYPNTEDYALRHVNLKFKVGEKLAVVGMNGSGKTTFIKLMCRLYDPTEGEILLNGVNIKKYDYDEYMSIFSVVFQDFGLFSFSLGQNVATSKEYDKERAIMCLEKAGFGERFKSMPKGLDTCIYKDYDKQGVEISGGEAQKLALARALYKDAPFIVLDEPTAALDPISEYEVYSNFNKIAGDKTTIYISHRLASCKFCDKIAVFDKGSIVQVGEHEELVENIKGKYYELWNAQAKWYTT